MYLSLRRPSGLSDEQMLKYLLLPKDAAPKRTHEDEQEVDPAKIIAQAAEKKKTEAGKTGITEPLSPLAAAAQSMQSRAALCGIRADLLSDESIKLLNLSHEWLHSLFPFVLTKISRVSFGVLNDDELASALKNDPKMPISRRFSAVPFVGTAHHRSMHDKSRHVRM
jgi:hypothetical protein